MRTSRYFKLGLLFCGDIVTLYLSLLVTLGIRYGGNLLGSVANINFWPFTVVFVPWLLIFYIAGLYDLRRLRNNIEFLKTLTLCLTINIVIAVIFFYFIPAFGVAPKTNLFIFFVVFAILEIFWRRAFNRGTQGNEAPNRAILVGDGEAAGNIVKTISENPQLGYVIARYIPEKKAADEPQTLRAAVRDLRANISWCRGG